MSTHNILPYFKHKRENHRKLSQICRYGIFFQGTQEQIQNSRGKRAISVQATKGLLFLAVLENSVLHMN